MVKLRPLFDHLPASVTIYEVGPRDGLQNEARMVPTERQDRVSSTRSPRRACRPSRSPASSTRKWIPQLADGAEVSRRIARKPGIVYSALVPNRQGLDAAIAAGMREVAVFMSASETHNKKNVNKTIAADARGVSRDGAARAGRRACACAPTSRPSTDARTRGRSIPAKALELCRALRALGCYQVSLGDTIGVATPQQVRDVLARVLAEIPAPEVAVHFHDTRGTALANILVAVEMGITTVDAALGGLGGCPYAPGASGNVVDRGRRLHAGGNGRPHRHRPRQAGRLRSAGVGVRRPRGAVQVLPRRRRRPLAQLGAIG